MTTRELITHLEQIVAKSPSFADSRVMFVIAGEDWDDPWYTTTEVAVHPVHDVLPWESEGEFFVRIEGRDGNTEDEDDE